MNLTFTPFYNVLQATCCARVMHTYIMPAHCIHSMHILCLYAYSIIFLLPSVDRKINYTFHLPSRIEAVSKVGNVIPICLKEEQILLLMKNSLFINSFITSCLYLFFNEILILIIYLSHVVLSSIKTS